MEDINSRTDILEPE